MSWHKPIYHVHAFILGPDPCTFLKPIILGLGTAVMAAREDPYDVDFETMTDEDVMRWLLDMEEANIRRLHGLMCRVYPRVCPAMSAPAPVMFPPHPPMMMPGHCLRPPPAGPGKGTGKTAPVAAKPGNSVPQQRAPGPPKPPTHPPPKRMPVPKAGTESEAPPAKAEAPMESTGVPEPKTPPAVVDLTTDAKRFPWIPQPPPPPVSKGGRSAPY